MSKIYYSTRNSVPRSCPICGCSPLEMIPTLGAEYAGYRIKVDRHPFWRIPRWYGECLKCSFRLFKSKFNTKV